MSDKYEVIFLDNKVKIRKYKSNSYNNMNVATIDFKKGS